MNPLFFSFLLIALFMIPISAYADFPIRVIDAPVHHHDHGWSSLAIAAISAALLLMGIGAMSISVLAFWYNPEESGHGWSPGGGEYWWHRSGGWEGGGWHPHYGPYWRGGG